MIMNRALSKKPLDFLYAIIWFGIFAFFAFYIFSGKMFMPDANNKISIVAILVGWIAEYLTQIGTGILVLLIGAYVAFMVATEKKLRD